MIVYYGHDDRHGECNVTPKMLRQMRAWEKAKIANISLIVYPEGLGRTYIVVHISNVNVGLSILRHSTR